MEDSNNYLIFSLLLRILSAISEAAFFVSVTPLALKVSTYVLKHYVLKYLKLKKFLQNSPKEKEATVLSVMETTFGLGMMLGPFFGGLLYEIGGFYFPFAVCGGSLMICAIISFSILESSSNSSENVEDKQNLQTKYVDLLKMPSVLICCFLLISAQMSISWTMVSNLCT